MKHVGRKTASGVSALTRRGFAASAASLLAGCGRKTQRTVRTSHRGGFARVILVGMDGLDPRLLRRLIREGRLPHFQAVASQGGLYSLGTSNPPQSPVSWATISTGVNPGRHGVFDFLHRSPDDYTVFLSITRQAGASLTGTPRFRSPLRCASFFQHAAGAGVPVISLRWPLTFPAKGPGETLTGLGTPDVTGGLGKYTLYTTLPISSSDLKRRHTVVLKGSSPFSTHLPGPLTATPDRADPLKGHALIPLTIRPAGKAVLLEASGHTIRLKEGGFSPLLRFRFPVGFLKGCSALGRFFLLKASDPLVLYFSPLHVDPTAPVFPIAFPAGYAAELERKLGGPYHTLGMPEDTQAVNDGVLPPEAFLASCDQIMKEQEKMLQAALQEHKEGLVGFVFFTPDRIQHLFFAGLDPAHPFRRRNEEKADLFDHARAFHRLGGEPIESCYKRLDGILALILKELRKQDLLLVLSDHGFCTYRRDFHVNRFLVNEGLMVLEEQEGRELFQSVRWDRTKAYSCGFAGIYLNREGREGLGIVSHGKAPEVARHIAARLKALTDPATGQHPVREVYLREKIYRGPASSDGPDLVVGLREGYRFSWQTALGGAPEELFSENTRPWSGTHLVDPSVVPGTLLCSAAADRKDLAVVDVAPTVLQALGVATAASYEGRSFLGETTRT